MDFFKKHRLKVVIGLIFAIAIVAIINVKIQQKYDQNPGLIPPRKNYDIKAELAPEKEMEYETNIIEFDKKIK